VQSFQKILIIRLVMNYTEYYLHSKKCFQTMITVGFPP